MNRVGCSPFDLFLRRPKISTGPPPSYCLDFAPNRGGLGRADSTKVTYEAEVTDSQWDRFKRALGFSKKRGAIFVRNRAGSHTLSPALTGQPLRVQIENLSARVFVRFTYRRHAKKRRGNSWHCCCSRR